MQKSVSRDDRIFQIKISLDRVRPPIWRRVLVPAGCTLSGLHSVIQTVIGWHGSHLSAFRSGAHGLTGMALDADMEEGADRFPLSYFLEREKSKILYEYDFGDSWVHTVLLEKICDREPGTAYPVCTAGRRAGPPEDCGGAWGYANLLCAITDPEHEDHEHLLEWVGGSFDPEAFDLNDLNAQLSKLAPLTSGRN